MFWGFCLKRMMQVLNANGFESYNSRPIKIYEHMFINANRVKIKNIILKSIAMRANILHYIPINWFLLLANPHLSHWGYVTAIPIVFFIPDHLQAAAYRLHWTLNNQDNKQPTWILSSWNCSYSSPSGITQQITCLSPSTRFLGWYITLMRFITCLCF